MRKRPQGKTQKENVTKGRNGGCVLLKNKKIIAAVREGGKQTRRIFKMKMKQKGRNQGGGRKHRDGMAILFTMLTEGKPGL